MLEYLNLLSKLTHEPFPELCVDVCPGYDAVVANVQIGGHNSIGGQDHGCCRLDVLRVRVNIDANYPPRWVDESDDRTRLSRDGPND